MTRRAHLTALAGVLLATGLVEPLAAQEDEGLFGVSPSRRVVVATPPHLLESSVLSNGTQRPLSVSIRPVLLGQNLDGSLHILMTAKDRAAARSIIGLPERRFRLQPGEERLVSPRWKRLPAKAKAAQVGIVYQGIPPRQEGVPPPIVRLVQPNLLRLPGRLRRGGRLVGLRAEQGERRSLRFFARVKNAGQAPETPRGGRLRISDARGHVVLRKRWRAETAVFPKSEVEVPIDVRRTLREGPYEAVVSADVGGNRSSSATSFTLVGPNELPTVRFDLLSLTASGEVEGPAELEIEVENNGSQTAAAQLSLELARAAGTPASEGDEETNEEVTTDELEPGETVTVEAEFGELSDVPYEVAAVARDRTREFDRLTTNLQPDPKTTLRDRIDDFFSRALAVGLTVGLIALVLLVALLVRAGRQRERLREELERGGGLSAAGRPPTPPEPGRPDAMPAAPSEQAAVRAERAAAAELPPEPSAVPEPAQMSAPPPGGAAADAININTASADELIKLPGVGRKAAERIVAYRDAHGPFASVNDLANVEGFDDPARIRRFADRATA